MRESNLTLIIRDFEPSIFQNNEIMQKKAEEKNLAKKKKNLKNVETKENIINKDLNKSQEKYITDKKNYPNNSKIIKNSTINNNTNNNETPITSKDTKKENPTSCRCAIL